VSKLDNGKGHASGLFLMVNTLERGGTERQFVTLANALAGGEFDVGLGCLRREGEFLASVPEILEFAPGGSLFMPRSLRTRLALAQHLRMRGTAVAHAFDFYANLMLIPAARLARTPVVIGSHRQLGDLQTRIQFRVQNLIFKMCDRVVCNSRAAASRLRQAGVGESKLLVIPNAVGDEAFAQAAPALPPPSNAQQGFARVGMIARMNDPSKNHRMFLRAAARLANRFERVEFVLVGDGPLRPGLEVFAAELGLGERVRFPGDRHDIPAILASLDVSVSASSSESLSNAILESMAAGVPVIATNVGGNPELVRDGETGFLVQLDEEALAQAMARFLADPELRKECGRRAKAFVSSHYRLASVLECYEQMYLSLLSEKSVPREPAKAGSFV